MCTSSICDFLQGTDVGVSRKLRELILNWIVSLLEKRGRFLDYNDSQLVFNLLQIPAANSVKSV